MPVQQRAPTGSDQQSLVKYQSNTPFSSHERHARGIDDNVSWQLYPNLDSADTDDGLVAAYVQIVV